MTKPTGRPRGRPTLFTEARRQQILGLLRAGNYRNTAAAAAGVAPSTLSGWIARGETATPPPDPEHHTKQQLIDYAAEAGIDINPRHTKAQIAAQLRDPYAEFAESVKRAEAEGEAFALQEMRRVGADDWRMWMTYLERKHPDRWGRRERFDNLESTEAGDPVKALERGETILRLVTDAAGDT